MTIKLGTPGVAANSTQLAQLRQDLVVPPKNEYFVTEYGAKFDGVTDDTAAITAAMQAAFDAGGGTVILPRGLGRVTSVVFNWGTAGYSINIKGQGSYATTIQKLGESTTPIFDFGTGYGGTDGSYSRWEDFALWGNAKTHHGIKVLNMSRIQTSNVKIYSCDVAFENVGSLIMSHYDMNWNSNNIGYRCTSNWHYANLVNFYGGSVSRNTTWGFDLDKGNGINFYGVDIERNGTTLNTSTGGMLIRSTVDKESGYAIIALDSCWMEHNYGTNMLVYVGGLLLSVKNTLMLLNEAGRVMNVGAITSLTIDNIMAPTVGDTVTTGALRSRISGGVISTITDTGADSKHTNVVTYTGIANKSTTFDTVKTHIYDGDAYFQLGAKIRVIAGTNGRAGKATLVGGTVTVSTNQVGTNTLVLITGRTDGGTPGWLRVSAITNSVSFVITSSSGTDTGVVSWLLVDAA